MTAWREGVAGTLADRTVDMTLGKRYLVAHMLARQLQQQQTPRVA